GVIDNGCECTGDMTKSCSLGPSCPGAQKCHFGKFGVCEPTAPKAEICDGVDNDCNGQIDDGSGRCPKGSRCVNGMCSSGEQVQEVGVTPDPEIEMYRGAGLIKGCSGSGAPSLVWLVVALLGVRVLRRRLL